MRYVQCRCLVIGNQTHWRTAIAGKAALDGLYIVRTSVPATELDAEQTVRAYKGLSVVERAFRSLKTVDLKVRPIYHYAASRVRAHVFLMHARLEAPLAARACSVAGLGDIAGLASRLRTRWRRSGAPHRDAAEP